MISRLLKPQKVKPLSNVFGQRHLPKLSDSYTEATVNVDSPRAGINPAPTEQVWEFK